MINRIILFLGIVVLSGCCPKIQDLEPIYIVKSYSDTIYQTDSILVPERSETWDLDIISLCDSLAQRGAKGVIELDSKKGINTTIKYNKGRATITSKCDSLVAILDSVMSINKTDTIEVYQDRIVYKNKKQKWWKWLTIGLIAGLILALLIKR